MTTPLLRERFEGCLIGQCVADALGFVVEGCDSETCTEHIDNVLSRGLFECGRGSFRIGQYTDDSQLARELLQSFVACGRFDPADYACRIAAIFAEGRIVGRGIATHEAASRLIRGVRWEDAGTEPPAAGNGTAMRAAPIGLLFFDDMERLIGAAHDQGRITHKDRRCSAGSIAVAGAVALVLRGEDPIQPAFTLQLSQWVRDFDPILADALVELRRWAELPPDAAYAAISSVGLLPGYNDAWPGISPFVTTTVLWSLYSYLKSPFNYVGAIRSAIAVGGDVDTTGAITGAISGATVGIGGLPRDFIQLLNDQGAWGSAELIDLADRVYTMRASALPTFVYPRQATSEHG